MTDMWTVNKRYLNNDHFARKSKVENSMEDLNQMLLKFDLKQNYQYEDFYVSKSNFFAFNLISSKSSPIKSFETTVPFLLRAFFENSRTSKHN